MATGKTQPSTLTLSDGRSLAYECSGDPDGQPLVFVHGFTACRLTRHPDEAATSAMGVRLITLDRPGVGRSSFQPGRTMLDFPADLHALLDHLAIERTAVLGHSAGGPYALACGFALADRVASVGALCGFAPMDRPNATEGMKKDMARAAPVLRRAPWLTRALVASLPRQYRRDPARAFERQFGRGLPECDRTALANPEFQSVLLSAAVEATAGGPAGLAQEMRLMFGPWRFDPSAITVPVRLFYGEDDVTTPPAMGRYLAASIPGAELTIYPGEGHTLLFTRWGEIVGAMT